MCDPGAIFPSAHQGTKDCALVPFFLDRAVPNIIQTILAQTHLKVKTYIHTPIDPKAKDRSKS